LHILRGEFQAWRVSVRQKASCHTLSYTSAAVSRRLKTGDMGGVVTVLLRAFQTSLLQTYKSKFTQARPTLFGSII
jgi:hypothetical protein